MILNIDEHPKELLAVVDSSGTTITYGELNDFSVQIVKYIPKRSIVFLLTANNVGGIVWSIGTINAGIVPLLLNSQIDSVFFQHLYSLYSPQFICIPEKQKEKYDFPIILEQYGYVLMNTHNSIYPIYNELSHLLPTSGSTGSPKLVRHCYRNIEAAGLNISSFFKLTALDRPLLVLPLYYTMGLSVVFCHFYVGATILITDLSMTDKTFWSFLKEQRATSFTGVPYSFEILKIMRFVKMNLPDLTLLTQGGGKMPRQLNLLFAEYARDYGKRWIATYGQTEGTARMTYLPPEFAISKLGSIGIAVPNAELTLIDENGKAVETSNTEGEMCYRGKNVTLGYSLNKEDLIMGDERNGFLRTGDLAYKDEDGCYYIVGRLGRFLKLYGKRVGLDECEQIIKSKWQVECACVGTDEKMIVYVEDRRFVKQIKEELVEKTKIVATAFDIKIIESIPKSITGKILYSQLNKY